MPDPVEGVPSLLLEEGVLSVLLLEGVLSVELLDGVLSVGVAVVVLVVDDGADAPELVSLVTPLAVVTPPDEEVEVLPGEPVLPVPKLSVP